MERTSSRKKLDAAPPAILNKPVVALAIVPLNRSLTVTARKAYNVMLHIAQREGDTGDAGFSAPLNAILRGFGSGNNISTDAKRYIDQMMSTKIEWRPLSEGEQFLLPLEEPATSGGSSPKLDGPTDEIRSFHMLSEVRLYKRAGENWVTWFYPPTIKEQMLGPNRWAKLELEMIARLSTYTSVALYEICARYRDNPGGVTSKHPCDWWVQVLKGSEGNKQREWRKFKNEFVNPAIKEINEVSDIEVELLEYKQGRAIADVQFGVRKKAASAMPHKPQPPDVTNLLHAARLGVREADVETFTEKYGESALTLALAAMERFVQANPNKPIANPGAYLKAVLADRDREGAKVPGQGGSSAAPPATPLSVGQTLKSLVDAGSEPVPQAGNRAGRLTSEADDRQAKNLIAARRIFEALDPAEQGVWVRRLAEHASGSGWATLNIMRRLQAGQWQSPLVTAMLMRFYAEQTFGPNWASMDLETEPVPQPS
ncbi:replication initiation protein [Aquincola sp. S2]|uniref:Replication initiation protein n=1 Tax=Pseudaquabacterium terrae TaxID=2732868 RepID=A0ABX2EUN7_9BURK|nr:replication initiation protein [Aquabacterium terrae]NRF72254.1 replication initiation protein [Aquabacterium terrae]